MTTLRSFFSMFALVVLCAISGSAQCISVQVDRDLFSDLETINVHAMPITGTPADCRINLQTGDADFTYVLQVFNNDTQQWENVGVRKSSLRFGFGGRQQRQPVFALNTADARLVPGSYRLNVVNTYGERYSYQDSLHFTVGKRTLGVAPTYKLGLTVDLSGSLPTEQSIPSAIEASRMPYIQAAAIKRNGYLYVRGRLTDSGRGGVDGSLYQPRADVTELVAVRFEMADSSDVMYANLPQMRGGTMDLGWIRVKVPNNTFDASRPVYASITANGGGMTINRMIYDPTDPSQDFEGFGVRQ